MAYVHDYAYDDAGNPIAATVTAYLADTTSVTGTPTTSDPTTGAFTISDVSDAARVDLKIQVGSTIRWIKGKVALPAPPLAHVTATGTQVLSNGGSEVAVIWKNPADYDNDGLWLAGSPTLLTIKTPGIYRALAWLTWAANTTGVRTLSIVKNFGVTPVTVGANAANALVTGGLNTSSTAAGEYQFLLNDTISVTAFQNSLGNLTLLGGMLSVQRIG